MKKIKTSNIILIVLICLTFLYLTNSVLITKRILIYTKLFIEKLFPASFLFFTLSTLLIEYNAVGSLTKIFKKKRCGLIRYYNEFNQWLSQWKHLYYRTIKKETNNRKNSKLSNQIHPFSKSNFYPRTSITTIPIKKLRIQNIN